MSLTMTKFRESAKTLSMALLTATFFAANANAAEPAKFVQVADLDLSKPIPSNVCVKDDAQGKAIDKMRTVMGARGQKSIVAGNQPVADTDPAHGGLQERMFTSTLLQGGEGYYVLSDRPTGKAGTTYCFSQNPKVYIYSVFNSNGVPEIVNKGELGVALTNNDKVGMKVAIAALTDKGTIAVVNFDPHTKKGSQKFSDAKGGTAFDLPLVDAGYSASLPISAKRSLGIPMDGNIASADIDKGKLLAIAPHPQ